MSKVRVYELARDLNIESKLLVTRMKGLGIEVASHQSSISEEEAQKIKEAIQSGKKEIAAAPTAAAARPTVIRRRRASETEAKPEEDQAQSAAASEQETAAGQPSAAAEQAPSVAQSASASPSTEEAQTSAASAEPRKDDAGAPRRPEPLRRVSANSAQIVRRAAPSERPTTMVKKVKEDARSTVIESSQFGPSTPLTGTEAERKKEKDRRKDADVEETPPVRRVVPKQKRSHLSTRALLNSLGEEEEVELVEPVVEAVEEVVKKTVYTPVQQHRKKDLRRRKDLKKTQITTPRAAYRVVEMGHTITVGGLGKQMGVKAGELIKKLMDQGVIATINQELDHDTVALIAADYKYEVQVVIAGADDKLRDMEESSQKHEKSQRPPIVTIMGHVDHGKTSILDAIRQTKVASREAGGITQHIGAYTVSSSGRPITFLDTPGHEAFSAMRSRGAKVTDIVILVVAGDDGVMPQTKEAISHAKASNVPLIVAINKMDKPNLNLDRIYSELTEYGIQSEEWGGETQFVKVSALAKTGLDELLEAVLLQAEILELKARKDGPAIGTVVEGHLDKGRGPVATVIVQQGTLRAGDIMVAGTVIGRVRNMYDDTGAQIESVGPSYPAQIIGLEDVPMAGDLVHVVADERVARNVADARAVELGAKSAVRAGASSLEELLGKVSMQEVPEVPVIIKADTQGSVEAISEAVTKINTDKVRNRIVHKAVGGVTESDISLAETSGGIIIAFNVRASRGLDDIAEKKGVPISYFSVIYDIVTAIKAVMEGKLPPILTEVILGHGEVRATIKVPKIGVVAGTAVTDGKITRNSNLRLIRDQVVIFSGKIGSLRRFKDDVKEVVQGFECGVNIEGCNDIREGDVIESYIVQEERPTL
jgi:translation initiation factor IF-2